MSIKEVSKFGFFNAIKQKDGSYDRVYDADDFANYFSQFIGNGVFISPANQLQVQYKNDSDSPFSVIVKKGKAYIDGFWYWLQEDAEIVVPANTTAYDVVDSIVCVLDRVDRTVTVRCLQDVAEGFPRNDDRYHDLVLCLITVGANSVSLDYSNFVDTRPNEAYCGYVAGLLKEIDGTEMFEQFQYIFQKWFENIKGQLSEDAAGNLQLQIDELFQSVSSGKALVASAITDKRVPTDATATFQQMSDNIRKIVLGSGNAVAADVLQGKTFTNDDGVQYTGTMPNINKVDTCPINPLYLGDGLFVRMNSGAHVINTSSGYPEVFVSRDMLIKELSITASKIIQGQSIAGVAGTVVAAPKSLEGSDKYWQAHEQVTRTVTFSTPFATTPSINVSGNIRDHGGTVKNMGVNVTNKSKAGFTYRTDTPPNYGDATVTWNAVV